MRKTGREIFARLIHLFRFLWSLWKHPGDRPCGWKQHLPEQRGRVRRKPEWVRRSIIRLAALMPHAGCRTLALVFNRQHAVRHMSVGKSWVAGLLREHAYEIAKERRSIRRRRAQAGPPNRVWGIDLTGRGDANGTVHTILGILDHGTRRLLCLDAVVDKSSWTLLGHLFLAVGSYGKPVAVRTDNERVFTSRLFTGVLRLIGIHHQRADKHCPWQNGRIERLFGTLKERLRFWQFAGRPMLQETLDRFGFWYNAVRPHQNLDGLTPLEAWNGVDPFAAPIKRIRFYSTWDGLLTGFYLRC